MVLRVHRRGGVGDLLEEAVRCPGRVRQALDLGLKSSRTTSRRVYVRPCFWSRRGTTSRGNGAVGLLGHGVGASPVGGESRERQAQAASLAGMPPDWRWAGWGATLSDDSVS